MTVMLVVLAGATLCEFGMELIAGLWRVRKFIAPIVIAGVSFAGGGVFMWQPSVASGLIGLASAYRVLNMLRVAEARMNEAYLRRVVRRTSLGLVVFQLVVGGAWLLDRHWGLSDYTWLVSLMVVQLLAAAALAISTRRALSKTKPARTSAALTDRELPTVTVAIPARNEDVQLENCLRSILASDYPKLEVLVLDDCSQDRTPEIIRGLAHDGVRFIPGEEPKPNWLAKNQAYARLAKEASGDLILFVGVDVRFAPRSVRELVATLLARSKTMLSVMPLNETAGLSLAQSMRYMWELALPRRLFNRPPVLSSCWLITTEQLKKSGGFAGVSRSITPEAYFAREAIKNDSYRFMRSDAALGITSVKTRDEQRDTAVRTRYPQLHRRPEFVCVVSLAELGLLVAPLVLALIGFSGVFGWPAEIAAIAASLILLLAYNGSTVAFPHRSLVLPLFPIAVLVDVGLLHYSMWKYEFSEVVWKGRNVCIPVMHTLPHLPKLS